MRSTRRRRGVVQGLNNAGSRLRVVERDLVDPGVLDLWRALQSSGAVDSPFSTWQWAQALASVPEVSRTIIVLCAYDAEQARGVLALERWRGVDGLRVLGLAAGRWAGPDHIDVVARPAAREAVAAAVVGHIAADPSWDVLDFEGLARDGALASELRRRLPGPVIRLPDRDVPAPFLDLRPREPALLLPSRNLRQQVSRGLRIAERTGGGLAVATTALEVGKVLPVLMDQHEQRFGTRSQVFATPARRQFHLTAAKTLAVHGMARVYRLEVDGRQAALLYALRLDDRLFYYSMGIQPDVGTSPGRTLLGQVALAAAAEGLSEFDLLRGDHAFKLRFASGSRSDLHVRLLRPTPRALLALGTSWTTARLRARQR